MLTHKKLQEGSRIDTIRVLHSMHDNISDRYFVADSYIEEGNFANARNTITSIPLDFDLNSRQIDENTNFVALCDFLSNLNDSNISVMELDSNKSAELEIIANGVGVAATKASNLLCFGYDICSDYPVITDTKGQAKAAHVYFPLGGKNNTNAYNKLSVKPNPAENYATFDWDLPLFEGKATLRIVDLTGTVLVQKTITEPKGTWIWDTRETVNGTYLYEIFEGAFVLANGKLLIQKI